MRKFSVLAAAAVAVVAFGGVASGGVASASDGRSSSGGRSYEADLHPIANNPPAHGSAELSVAGRKLTVRIHASGLTPNLPHAMHIHGVLGDKNSCPPGISADTNHDGLVSLSEGAPFYGPIDVSFTTTGDTSPKSGLVLERFPVADAHGNLDYNRSFMIPKAVAKDLTQLHIVVHGNDLNHDGAYSNFMEKTLPVACGAIER